MASDVLALIPARAGSKGIPNKNFERLAGGAHPLGLALWCAKQVGCIPIISSDHPEILVFHAPPHQYAIRRPVELATDSAAMIDVVTHTLAQIPGPPDQIILLVQPTQPLRQPKHLRAAIALLESSGADSVVSVVEVPSVYNLAWQLRISGDWLLPWVTRDLCDMVPRRQELIPTFIRDGTCYVFRRSTLAKHGNIYGENVRPLIIPPEETCPLDSEADWLEAERRLRAHSDRTE